MHVCVCSHCLRICVCLTCMYMRMAMLCDCVTVKCQHNHNSIVLDTLLVYADQWDCDVDGLLHRLHCLHTLAVSLMSTSTYITVCYIRVYIKTEYLKINIQYTVLLKYEIFEDVAFST